ncbi:MAG: alpha/beta hydrolase [Gammaproteobacteria bacterium]|nr:alpha/beta hydrolase [Gammaproteobacteria bacterium]
MTITTRDHFIPSGQPGLQLLLRHKRVAEGGPALLFVHGATYPSTVTFDYPVEGQSWMDRLALAGFDAWCLDLLGYGGADRPPAMSRPAEDGTPLVDTAEAVRDTRLAVDYIRAARGVAALGLIGYSWGTAICGQVAGEMPEAVRRLVLAGALWTLTGAQITVDGPLGAWRSVDAEATARRWLVNLDEAQRAAVAPSARVAAWAAAAIASDPESSRHSPPRLRAPTGVVKDVTTRWMRGEPTWEPARVRCPTLVVVGEWDQETTVAQGSEVFARLTAAPRKRLCVIGGATHLMLLEEQRGQLYEVVESFLRP